MPKSFIRSPGGPRGKRRQQGTNGCRSSLESSKIGILVGTRLPKQTQNFLENYLKIFFHWTRKKHQGRRQKSFFPPLLPFREALISTTLAQSAGTAPLRPRRQSPRTETKRVCKRPERRGPQLPNNVATQRGMTPKWEEGLDGEHSRGEPRAAHATNITSFPGIGRPQQSDPMSDTFIES